MLSGKYKKGGGFLWSYTKEIKLNPYIKIKKQHNSIAKTIQVINLETNELKLFRTLRECAVYFKVTSSVINYVIHKSKSHVYLKKYKITLKLA